MFPQGIATFPGVDQIVSASISVTHGITPAVASMEIAPQTHYLAEGGLLRFQFGEQVIDFPDCKVDYLTLQRTARGLVWRLTIFDRRWKWRFGSIAGQYNHLDAAGDIERVGTDESWEKTPQELATLCLEAMAEENFEVDELPNDIRPVIDWDEVNPAGALAKLCDDLGCRVVKGLDNIVRIKVAGAGADLPMNDLVMQNALTVNPPEKPKEIGVTTGPTRFQADFPLEAVGIDNDTDEDGKLIGTIVPVAELAYKPTAGWGSEHPNWMAGVSNAEDKKLAIQSVWRYYRIALPVDNTLLIADEGEQGRDGEEEDQDVDYYIEYLNEQVATRTQDGEEIVREPVVYGTYYAAHGASLDNEPDDTTYPEGTKIDHKFTFDRARGLVIFSEPTYRNTSAGASLDVDEATLFLRAACILRWPDTREYRRHFEWRQIGEFETLPRMLRHDEMYLTYIDGEKQDTTELDKQIDYYLDAAEKEYDQEMPQSVTYAGLQLVPLDGAIRQATFTVGRGGCTSVYSRNTEQLDRVPSYKERRLTEQYSEQQIMYEKHIQALRRMAKPHRALWVGDSTA